MCGSTLVGIIDPADDALLVTASSSPKARLDGALFRGAAFLIRNRRQVPSPHRGYASLSEGAVVDLAVWLRSLGLEPYEAVFRENAITEKLLPSLTAED